MEKKILIAVYDSLRKEGSENLTYLEDSKFIGNYYTEPIYDLYSLNKHYAALVKNGNTSVLLEIHEVDGIDMINLDYFYGIGIKGYMPMYVKEVIDTSYGECVIFIYNKEVKSKPKIYSGDYIAWKKNVLKEMKKVEEFTSRFGIE